ncbi:MAG: FAD:protein FMN transferase, partial [Myxococcota bacterium]|nr:FAD:protein FMN transferase [Myxococcota bacterium]
MIGLPRPIRVAILAVAVLAGGCRRPAVERAEGEFLAMGGIPIRVVAHDVDPDGFERFVADYRMEVQRLESVLSVHRMRSVVSRLNASSGRPFPLEAEPAGLLRESLALAAETGGAFDPTVGPLPAAWKEAARAGVPAGPGLQKCLVILVVDDNARYRKQLQRMIGKLCPRAIIYEADGIQDAVHLAQ